jgi:hypothetical protein
MLFGDNRHNVFIKVPTWRKKRRTASRDPGVPRNAPSGCSPPVSTPGPQPARSIGEQPSSGSSIKRNLGTSFQMSVPAPPAAAQFVESSSASAGAQERGTKRTRPSASASAPAPARTPAPAPAPATAPAAPGLAPVAPPTRSSSGSGKGKRPLGGFANKTVQSGPGRQQSFRAPISNGIAFQQSPSQQAAPAPSCTGNHAQQIRQQQAAQTPTYNGNHAQQSFSQQVASAPVYNSHSIRQSVPPQLPMTPAHNGFQAQQSQLRQFAQRAATFQQAPRQYPWTRVQQTQQNGALGYTNPHTPARPTTTYGGGYPLTPPPSPPLTPKKPNPLSCKREKAKKTMRGVDRIIQLKQGRKRVGKVETKRQKQQEKSKNLNKFKKQIKGFESRVIAAAAVGDVWMDCRPDYPGWGKREMYGK